MDKKDAREALERVDVACEHVEKFKSEVLALYATNNHFVSLDDPIKFHCHVCSAIFKIPSNLMWQETRTTQAEKRRPQAVVTRFRAATSVNVPDFSEGSPTPVHVAVELDPPVTFWFVKVEDGVSEWRENYASQAEKDAFLRGFMAASAMHGDPMPTIVEVQR